MFEPKAMMVYRFLMKDHSLERVFPSEEAQKIVDAPLAQLAEQVTLNHWVVGSIPTRCTPDSEGLTAKASLSRKLYLRVAYAFLELKALLKTLANRARFLRPTA